MRPTRTSAPAKPSPLRPWSKAMQAVQARYQTLASRERVMVLSAVLVVGLALLWLVLLAPALETLKRVHAERPALESQWQHMLGLQQQAQALKAQPRINAEQARRALENSVSSSFGKAGQLQWSGERATVTLTEVDADSLTQWLTRARTEANAVTVQTRLTRAPGDAVRWSGFVSLETPQP